MAYFLTASLLLALLVFSFSVSADQRNITAEPGDNVILTCRAAENKDVKAAEWKKTNQRFCLYLINSFQQNDKPECSNSRADLQDVKKGDVSLVLKNVTTDDRGTYECWIKEDKSNRRKRSVHEYELISTIDLRVEPDQRTIRANPGEDATLPCRAAENRHLEAAEWKKTNQSLCIYRINSFGEDKPVCSNSRADLQDVKNGDVSLVLKNVKTDDTGRYECWIKETTNNRRKRSVQDTEPISIFNLRVEAGNQDGGNKGGQKKDGGNEDRSKEDGGSKTGLIAGLLVCAVVVLLVPAVLYKRSRYSSLKSKCPPAVAAAVIGDTTLKELVEKNPKY